MNFTTNVYHVVGILDFLDYLVKTDPKFQGEDTYALMENISESGKVSFGDAVNTIVYASDICNILKCDCPKDVDPHTFVGLGS